MPLLNYSALFQIKELELSKPKSSSENETNDDDEEDEVWGRKNNIPLLDQHTELRKLAEGNKNIHRILFLFDLF